MELPSPMYLGSGVSDSHFGYANDPSLGSGPTLQEMIDSDMKADFDDVITGNNMNFQGMDSLDMLNDLDTISFLDNGASGGLWSTSSVSTPSTVPNGVSNSTSSTSHSSGLHPTSYASFSNSYLEDLNGSASVMVNPNNVMPLHTGPGLQHQTVANLSVNVNSPSVQASQNSPHSPMPSPMFNQQQQINPQAVYQQPLQRPAKSVRVLPPVSSPAMQQVRFYDKCASISHEIIIVIYLRSFTDFTKCKQSLIFDVCVFSGAHGGSHLQSKFKQKEKPKESKLGDDSRQQRRQRKRISKACL